MNIDTVTLHCFLALAETKSFTKAAERVGRTQPAISQQMSKLEALLGKTLYVRGKTFSLTPEGNLFLSYARQIFALHREVLDRFKEPDLEGEVRFGLPEDFSNLFLSSVLTNFVQHHPRILLNIECDFTLNLFERFKKKEFDLVLVKMNRPEDLPNGVDVWSEPLVWAGNISHLNKAEIIPLVLSPQPCVYRASAIKALQRTSRKWRIVFTSPSYTSTIAAVKAGMGITALPRTMIPEEIEVIDSKPLPLLDDIHVSLLKHRSDSLAINSFEEFVLKKIRH
jgi:DNA-binding transcriptional LysR family regulator